MTRRAGRPSRAGGVPLWLWMGLRMSILAVTAVVLIAVSMRIYFVHQDWTANLHLPPQAREHVRRLAEHPRQNADELWEIFRRYSDIESFLPDISDRDWWMLIKMVAVSIPFIIIAALFVSRSITRQFTSLGGAVRQVRDGDFSVRIDSPQRAPQELVELTANFNDMGDKLAQYERELSESSAMLAHELRTPLNAAMGRLQAMLDDVFPLEPEQLRKVHAQLEQINRLVGDLHLVSLARAGQLGLEFDRFSLTQLVSERVEWVALRLAEAGVSVRTDLAGPLTMTGDRDRIGQTISILIENVLRYAADGKLLEIAAEVQDGHVLLALRDRGPGVDERQLERIVDRFWRAEGSRSRHLGGSGLGLAIAAAICQSHGGTLTCRNRPGGGLEVAVKLPLMPPLPRKQL